MKRHSKLFTRLMVVGLAAGAFVLSASRVATSTTFVYRTVNNCIAATNESPVVVVIPGWSCGLQAGSDNNGAAMSGQLSSVYFDYYQFNTSPAPTIQMCIVKSSFSGTSYSDCVRPSTPGNLPRYVDQYVQPINVKQNPNLYDYVWGGMSVFSTNLYADYTPRDVRILGVAFITGY